MNLGGRFIPDHVQNLLDREAGDTQRNRLRSLAAGRSDVIGLNSGDPDLTAPPVVVEAAVDALGSGVVRLRGEGRQDEQPLAGGAEARVM